MKKIVIGLLAAMALSWAQTAYAAPNTNPTEFGIEGDLTVLGLTGTTEDPDVAIKGFTVFGSTQTSYPGPVQSGAGNVVVNGYLAVSSGAYFTGGSTFTGSAYFTGISSFSSPSNIFVGGTGTLNQVLKKAAGGGMVWGDDNLGAGEITGTPRRLVMFQTDGGGGSDSLLQQDNSDLSITMITGSSMTILGNGTDGLGVVSGATKLGGTLGVTGASSLSTLGTSGLATLNSASVTTTLGVTGAATLSNNLTVSSNTLLGSDYGNRTAVNRGLETGVALSVAGDVTPGKYAAKFYSGANLAAWIMKK